MSSGQISGAAEVSRLGRPGVWRGALTWAMLIAFALQSYVTQTHVHHLSAPQAASATTGPIAAQASTPGEQEEIACPLCQAIAAAGAFVSPAPIVVRAPAIQAEAGVLPLIVIGLAIPAAGFSWHSRAPPQL